MDSLKTPPVRSLIKPKRRHSWIRLSVQAFFFILVLAIAINKSLAEAGLSIPLLSSASLHALCPFGGVVSIYQFVTVGTFVQKIHDSSFILMALVFFLAVLFGPVFCGWVCPLGSLQEWIGRLGKRIFRKHYNRLIPGKLDQYLRFIRYIVLLMVVYVTATSARLAFEAIDPYYALFNFWSKEVSLMALSVLGVVILLSLVVERPWCKYACPYGAVLGLTNLFKIFKIRRNASSCTHCKACDKACPMNISVHQGEAVRHHQCISCMKCTSEYACPVADTVTFSTKKGGNRS